MDILFLDANILFSAAYRKDAKLLKFWQMQKVVLVTSAYAVEEALRNLKEKEQIERLEHLLLKTKIIPTHPHKNLPLNVEVRDKDQPILAAALFAKADYLITGDYRDFGKYFGKNINGTTVLPPADYFNLSRK